MDVVYLCGGMEKSKDGRSWRIKATDLLSLHGFGVWNPYLEEENIKIPNGLDMNNLDRERDFKLLNKYMRNIIVYDFNVLFNDITSVLVRLDQGVLDAAGSMSEMSFAAYLSKPVHVWLDGLNLEDLPLWLCGALNTYSYSLEGAIDNLLKWELQ